MKHFRQGLNECFPTAIACYMEQEPEKVIEDMLGADLAPYGWCTLTWNPYNPMLKVVLLRIERFLQAKLEWLPMSAFLSDPSSSSYRPYTFPEQLEGTGFLTCTLFDGSMYRNRHIIAFENNIVYDTNQSGPVDYKPYRIAQINRNRLVDGIYLEPRKERNVNTNSI